jgi:uncharacterized protein
MSNSRPLAVITGASSGLGEVFAHKLAARGYDLLLVARRLDRLENICRELERSLGVHAEPVQADLADEGQTSQLARKIESAERLELLVNNAGFATLGLFHITDWTRQVEMVRLHVLATMALTRAALPGMIERRRGAIINVSSVAGYFRSAQNVGYCATKGSGAGALPRFHIHRVP